MSEHIDEYPRLKAEALLSLSPHLHYLDDSLWAGAQLGKRSEELTPLYVDRYHGPRGRQPALAHAWWELTVVMGGMLRLEVGVTHVLGAGDLALVPAGCAHGEEADVADTIWVGLRGALVPDEGREGEGATIVRAKWLTEAAERAWLFARQQGGTIGPELDGMVRVLVGGVMRLAAESAPAAPARDWVVAAVEHIERNLAEPLRLAALARRFGCSVGHFGRAFRARTGHTPIAYLLRARIRRAAHLLENTDWSVAQVGRAIGIEDPFYFSRIFRRIMGQSPSAYRITSNVHLPLPG